MGFALTRTFAPYGATLLLVMVAVPGAASDLSPGDYWGDRFSPCELQEIQDQLEKVDDTVSQGNFDQARRIIGETREKLREKLPARHFMLKRTDASMKSLDQILALEDDEYEQALKAMFLIGYVFEKLGKTPIPKPTVPIARKALATCEEVLGKDNVYTVWARSGVAMSLYKTGQYDTAVPELRSAIAACERRGSLEMAGSLGAMLANIMDERGQYEEQWDCLSKATGLLARASGTNSSNYLMYRTFAMKAACNTARFLEALKIRKELTGRIDQIKTTPEFARLTMHLFSAEALLSLGRCEEGIEELNVFIRLASTYGEEERRNYGGAIKRTVHRCRCYNALQEAGAYDEIIAEIKALEELRPWEREFVIPEKNPFATVEE